MSIGKYSPSCPHASEPDYSAFRFNCYGKEPEPWSKEIADSGVEYNQETMFDNYDSEGFDSYGYSAFNAEGDYVGIGEGIDRHGYTEMEYLMGGGRLYDEKQRGY
jgi:hypothetical protein